MNSLTYVSASPLSSRNVLKYGLIFIISFTPCVITCSGKGSWYFSTQSFSAFKVSQFSESMLIFLKCWSSDFTCASFKRVFISTSDFSSVLFSVSIFLSGLMFSKFSIHLILLLNAHFPQDFYSLLYRRMSHPSSRSFASLRGETHCKPT